MINLPFLPPSWELNLTFTIHAITAARTIFDLMAPIPAVPDLKDRRLFKIILYPDNDTVRIDLKRATQSSYTFKEFRDNIQFSQMIKIQTKNEFISISPGEDWQWRRNTYMNGIQK